MQTTIVLIGCVSGRADEISEVLSHLAGVSESYVTGAEEFPVIAVLRVPERAMSAELEQVISKLDGVDSIRAVPVVSARPGDDLARIHEDYE